MKSKYKELLLKGNNAKRFEEAINKSRDNVFDYKDVQEKSLYKLRELSKLLKED